MYRSVVISLLLIGSASSNAAIIDIVDNGYYTTDAISGLHWLDVTASTDRTYDDVSSQFGVGGDFAGWRYASGAELDTLLTNAGLTPVFPGCANGTVFCSTVNEVPTLESLFDMLGPTVPPSEGGPAIYANLSDPASGSEIWSSLIDRQSSYINTWSNQFETDFSDQLIGNFLVAETLSTVPVPATVWLLGSALAGLGWMRRKQTS